MTEQNGQPTITIVDDYDAMSRRAADVVVETIAAQPTAAITVPTGSTPVGMYAELVKRIQAGEADFSQTKIFCLDDYLGQTPDDDASLTKLLIREFLKPGNIPDENVHYMPTMAEDPAAAAEGYEQAISDAGGLELAVIGLGPNGHVAFNEPGSAIDARTRVIDLTQESRDQNAAYYEEGAVVPEQAMTMGLGTILAARRIVMIVSGEGKAEIVREALEGPMTADVPGSWLRLAGDRLEVVLDKAAASALSK
ncbi:MAG TPA: glucosamine-6-phosphate deaminase [Thermomicrobiales bacterium]|nr:glucosamine-6-phosphate deaminase [Thermomicrobiales bacterium]